MPFSGLDLTGFFVPALNERESTVAFDINERGQIAGAPQVGFSAAMRKINSRSSFGVGLRPNGPRPREISLQYMRKPARCQRTTVSGVTMMSDCFHCDHSRLMATQKSLSNRLRAGRRRCR